MRVSGLVLTAENGESIAGATVRVSPWRGEFVTTTDERGEWTLLLPPDRYEREEGELDRRGVQRTRHRVTAEAGGRLRRSAWFEVLHDAERARGPTLRLRRIAARIGGRVLDAEKRQVPDLPVAFGFDRRKIWRTTDAEGRFGPVGVGAGDVVIRARETVRKLHIDPTGEPREIDVELIVGPQRYLAGVVVDDAGAPVAGATVTQAFSDAGFPVTTDDAGRFRWAIPAGNAWIEVAREGYVDPAVSHRDERDWTIELMRIVPISGRILTAAGEPSPGLWLKATQEGGPRVAAFSRADGTFRLEPWLAGRLEILVLRGEILVGDAVLEVVAGEAQPGVEIRLPEPVLCQGEVVDTLTGKPLAGVRVYSDPSARGEPDAVTGEDGRFVLPHHPSRIAKWDERVTLDKRGYEGGREWLLGEAVAGPHWFGLRPLGKLRFRVLDADGNPVPGLSVARGTRTDADGVAVLEVPVGKPEAYRISGPGYTEVRLEAEPQPGQTVDLGDVRLPPPTFDITLIVTNGAGEPVPDARLEDRPRTWRADDAGRIRAPRWNSQPTFVTAPGYEEVTVYYPGDGRDEMTVTLRKSAVLRGRVLDERGRPVAGFEVHTSGRLFGYDGSTDGLGRFEIRGLPAGVAVPIHLSGDYDCWDWALGEPGGDPVEIRLPGMGCVKVRIGKDPPESVGKPGLIVWLLDQKDVDQGGPVRHQAQPRHALRDGCFAYRVPAGRLSLRFQCGPGAERAYGPLRLTPGGEVEVSYDFPAPGRATLLVRGADGKPVKYGDLYDAEGGDAIASTDEEGRIALALVRDPILSGLRRLRVSAFERADLLTGEIDLDPEREVVLTMERGGGVDGSIHRRDGSPAAGARVCLVSAVGPHEYVAIADAAGHFSLPDWLRTGRRTIEVRVGARPPLVRQVVIEEGKVARIAVVLPF